MSGIINVRLPYIYLSHKNVDGDNAPDAAVEEAVPKDVNQVSKRSDSDCP